jgi:hypothetical protein
VLLTYHHAFSHQWAMDDAHFIVRNPAVTHGPRIPLLRAVETAGGAFYRPLSMGLFSLIHALFGGGPRAFHVLALAGHALASCLVAALTARMSTRWAGLAAGCLFAVHPVHVEAVASATNSTEVYATACWLGALWVWAAHGDRAETSRPALLGAVYALGLAGMLFKESAITLPLAMLVLERTEPFRARKPVATGVTLAAMGTYLALRQLALRGVFSASVTDGLWTYPWRVRVLTVLEVVARYGRLLLAPTTFSASYRGPVFGPVSSLGPAALAGAAGLLALSAALARALRRGTAWTAGLAWLLAGLALYLHALPIIPLMAERFLYLPSVGLCVAAGVGLDRARARRASRRIMGLALACLCLWFGLLSARRNLDWTDRLSLWGAEVANHRGGSAFSRFCYGVALLDAARADEALRWMESAVCDRDGRVEYARELGKSLGARPVAQRRAAVARVRACLRPTDPRVSVLERALADAHETIAP